jgi:hypothetical protein
MMGHLVGKSLVRNANEQSHNLRKRFRCIRWANISMLIGSGSCSRGCGVRGAGFMAHLGIWFSQLCTAAKTVTGDAGFITQPSDIACQVLG